VQRGDLPESLDHMAQGEEQIDSSDACAFRKATSLDNDFSILFPYYLDTKRRKFRMNASIEHMYGFIDSSIRMFLLPIKYLSTDAILNAHAVEVQGNVRPSDSCVEKYGYEADRIQHDGRAPPNS
jgi:hypothetical protein